MTRTARAGALAATALACGGIAASLAGGYRDEIAAQYGPLRAVVVARDVLRARRELKLPDARALLGVRRVPARFVPVGSIASPAEAVGKAPTARIPAGAYLLSSQLRPARSARHASERPSVPAGRQPVEISVTGAEPLLAAGPARGRAVDVVVTTDGATGGGRTYVAAEGVRLLGLRAAEQGSLDGAVPEIMLATLALTRSQALRLIRAQSFAREVRLISRAR